MLGEGLAGADTTSPAECVVALFVGVGSLKTVEEAFGAEGVGLGKFSWVAVDRPHVAGDACVFGDEVASIFIVLVVVMIGVRKRMVGKRLYVHGGEKRRLGNSGLGYLDWGMGDATEDCDRPPTEDLGD